MLIEVYGSLLNQDERKKIKGTMTEKGKIERKGWKLSFDKKSFGQNEAILNLVRTNDPADAYYTCVYEVDEEAHTEIMRREMGQGNIERWTLGVPVRYNSYLPQRLESSFGTTEVFVIPEKERKPTSTIWEALYVRVVRKGIEESFKDMPKEKEINLQVLKKAVEESSNPKSHTANKRKL
jgi:hypothetical protein